MKLFSEGWKNYWSFKVVWQKRFYFNLSPQVLCLCTISCHTKFEYSPHSKDLYPPKTTSPRISTPVSPIIKDDNRLPKMTFNSLSEIFSKIFGWWGNIPKSEMKIFWYFSKNQEGSMVTIFLPARVLKNGHFF